jgi:copper chaperone
LQDTNFVFFVTVVALFCVCADRGTPVAEHLTLTVNGMTCGGCENAVKRALSMIGGVSAVTASHSDRRVTVDFDASQTTRAAIEKAIENAGYEVAAG